MEILEASIEELATSLNDGTLTSVQLTNFYLDRIAQHDKQGANLNSIQFINSSAADDAQKLDIERTEKGPRSLLHGIPVIVKDNYETMGMPTTAGSKLFAGFAPQRDAHMVARLKSAGAIIIGKATMHEFAYGITTVGSAFGATRNPYNLQRNPGGSSGGTGAAVAANFAVAGMGSDTCGSIRIPSAHNNLVGLRGTQGLSSRSGIIPLSSTQDIGGPLARSVRDLAIMLDHTVGYDADDPQTAESYGQTNEFLADLEIRTGVRIGLLGNWLVQEEADTAVADVIQAALTSMHASHAWQTSIIESPELNRTLDRPFDGHFVLVYDFKQDINAYLAANPELGFTDLTSMLAAGRHHPALDAPLNNSETMSNAAETDYLRELAQRKHVRRALLSLMSNHALDALAYPTIRRIAAPIGEQQLGTNCRLAANSGLPAISVPAGFADGMPVGLELLAEPWAEQKLLNFAYTIEKALAQRRAPVL